MEIKLGYAIYSNDTEENDLVRKLEKVLEFQSDAIELSLSNTEKMKHPFTNKTFSLLKHFKYRSIHTPARIEGLEKKLKYPSDEGNKLLEIIDEIADNIEPSVILFHPDLIDDFDWLNSKYGKLLAFENMDIRKKFGATISDLQKVFEKSPQAKWVFDVNHLYTVDKNMDSAKTFFDAFKDRLTHYHVSGYGGWHECFSVSQEDIILKGLFDSTIPMIHEGNAVEKDLLKKEYDYISHSLDTFRF